MKPMTLPFVAAAAAVALLFSVPAAVQADPAEQIEERQDFMKGLAKELRGIRNFVQEAEGAPEDVVEAARRIGEKAEEIPSLFPAGTGMHEVELKTGARPEIWEDPEDFAAKAANLRELALNFAEEVEKLGDDRTAIGRGLASLGRDGCGACHQVFREDLD